MAQDFYIAEGTHDWFLEDGTTVLLCETVQDLTRQRVAINLKLIYGEWFANRALGVPYFESIFGKNTKNASDAILKNTIINTEGVVSLTSYESTLNNQIRTLTVTYSAETESGSIINEEVEL